MTKIGSTKPLMPTPLQCTPGTAPTASAGARPASERRAFGPILREQPTPAAPTPATAGPLAAQAAPAPTAPQGPNAITRTIEGIVGDKRSLDRAMRRAMRGGQLSPEQALALQMKVQSYSLQVETASRIVDRVTGAAKTVMQSQG